MHTIKEEIRAWGERAVERYIEIAKTFETENGSAFYTQSPLDIIEENPDLVIMGINPGSTGPFAEQIMNPNWQRIGFPKFDAFLKGNVAWESTKKVSYWTRICSILNSGGLGHLVSDDKKFVCTNITPFGTKKEKDLRSGLMRDTAQLSLKLLEILKPKIVLCLGVRSFNELCRISGATDKTSVYGSVFSYAHHGGYVIVGIHHPAYYYSNEQKSLVGRCLQLVFSHHGKITADEIRKETSDSYQAYLSKKQSPTGKKFHVDLDKVTDLLKNTCYKYEGKKGKPTYRFRFCDSHPIAITITNTQKGYIAIRHDERKDSYQGEEFTPDEKQIREWLLNGLEGYKEGEPWWATKQFSNFGDNEETIIHAIVEECKVIKEYITKGE